MNIPPNHPYASLLAKLVEFVEQERVIASARCIESWERPMEEKLRAGLAQQLVKIEAGEDGRLLVATLGKGESRFREGDRLCIHDGSAFSENAVRGVVFEHEGEDCWELRCRSGADARALLKLGTVYAEQDVTDLSAMFLQALADIAMSGQAGDDILALLDGRRPFQFNPQDDEYAYQHALAQGLNALQAEAVGKAYSAEQVACIQGPPGTGKTRVLALAVAMMVARGERVLVTSHTHTAINNALSKIAAHGVPTLKVGSVTQVRGLGPSAAREENFADWDIPAAGGYVVGATPFATCSTRLQGCAFDTVIFDEASQVTVPLALMAMRAGKRFVFIGDQQQLPPVVLSQSILSASASVFSRLTADNEDSVMLRETYRMNRWLTAWPSRSFYGSALAAAGANAERTLAMGPVAPSFAAALLAAPHSAVFVPTLDRTARSRNVADASLVVAVCAAAREGGVALADIGIVTPYRSQGRAIRTLLKKAFGSEAKAVVADTVERMQGQERELVILSLATGDLAYLAAVAGFFFQRERLNVSVTRAMTKLVIIGPEVPPELSCDDDLITANMALYRDLVASCERFACPP